MSASTASVVSPRTALWALRVLWLGLAPVMAFAVGDATEGRSASGSGLWWLALAAAAVAMVVPGPVSLTVVRMVLPATAVGAALTITFGAGALGVLTLAIALLAVVVAFAGETGEAFVQASAYGDERRFPLRPPATMVLPMAVTWAVWCTVVIAAALLLSGRYWVAGGIALALGAAATVLLFRRFDRFAQRWLVLVPAGVVVHDPVVLADTLMVARPNLRRVCLAPADTEAADLTGPAAGHAVEITVGEMALAVLAGTRAEPKGKALHVQSLLIAPTRPGRALQAMAGAKLPVA